MYSCSFTIFSNINVPQISIATGEIKTFAGTRYNCGFDGDNVAATSTRLNFPGALWVDTLGSVFVVDRYNNRIRKIEQVRKD